MIRLRTLGALDLRDADGRELRGVLAQPKRAALLVYLALATPRGPRRRDTLLALFWPELDAERARNALNQSVHFLRRSLGTDVVISNNGDELSVDWSDLWCDAVAFEEALDAGRAAEAVELHRGELLEGFHVANAPELERWLEAERSRLGVRYARAVEAAAGERERAGDRDGSVAYWRQLAARDPYSSRSALGLMRAMAAAGDPAAAVRHARVHEALLKEELALAPDPEVTALVRKLRAEPGEQQRPLAPSAPPSSNGSSVDAQARDVLALPPLEAPHAARAVPSDTVPERAPASVTRGAPRRGTPRRTVVITAGLVAICAVAAGAFAGGQGWLSASIPPVRSIAVLPFVNLSGNSADQFFADGMHDALMSELQRYPELSVISRTSVMQFRGTNTTLPEIARALKVDGVVEAALLREGDRIRLNAQLFHGPSERRLWADSYRRNQRDILSLQGELAAAIARAVRVATAPVARVQRKPSGPPDSVPPELYLRELYLRGWRSTVSRSPTGIEAALGYFRRVIERDSSFALGYAGLSEAYTIQAYYDLAPRRGILDSARITARRAVELDSMLPETRTALAVSLGNAGDFDAAEQEFKRAIELGPSNAGAHYHYSMLLVALGRGEDALAVAERTLELDPFVPQPALNTKRSAQYLMTGERDHLKLPVKERRAILTVEPGAPWPRARDAVELAEEGRCDEARSQIAKAQLGVPDDNMTMLMFAGQVSWLCGERARARAMLAGMKRRPDALDHGLRIGQLHTRFGEKDSAFAWLKRHRWLTGELVILQGDHFMDPLRSDKRFDELLRRIGVSGRPPATVLPPP